MGRKKLDMEYIKSKNTRSRTFSNRKHGILKKASELSTLCNVDVGVIIFGPNDLEKSYIWPQQPHQLNKILQRYQSTTQEERLKRASNLPANSSSLNNSYHGGIDGLSGEQLMELMNSLDAKLGAVNERVYMLKNCQNYSSCVSEEQEVMTNMNMSYNFQCDDQQYCANYGNQDQMMMMQMKGGNDPMINANTNMGDYC